MARKVEGEEGGGDGIREGGGEVGTGEGEDIMAEFILLQNCHLEAESHKLDLNHGRLSGQFHYQHEGLLLITHAQRDGIIGESPGSDCEASR